MPKKLLSLCLSFLMAVTLSAVAQGTEASGDSCKVASAYSAGENLYVFLESQGEPLPEEMDLLLNQAQVDTASPESLSDSNTPVNYLFLLDLSTSMIEYQDQIVAFSDSLFAQETQPVQVTVAGFGDRFEILAQALTSDQDVSQAIRSVVYDHTATDVPGGVFEAARYLATETVPQGEVMNVVVFTDGIPWPEQSESRTEEAAALKETIAGTPEMVLHSVVFGMEGNQEILAALATGTGQDVAVGSTQDAVQGGKDVANLVDGLSKLTFQPGLDLNTPRFEGQVFFNGEEASSSFLVLANVRNYAVELPEDTTSTPQPQKSFEPEPTPSTQPSPDPAEPVSEVPEESAQPSSSSVEEPSSAVESSSSSKNSEETGASTQSLPWIWIAVGGGLLVVILVVVGVLLRSRSKGNKTINQTGVAIKLAVISGHQKGNQKVFYLNQPLVIGSGVSCQLVWKDKGMPAQSARVFLQDQAVYIEGIAPAEVYVGGIRIHSANRLRSGDEITIANTKFCFRF